MDQFEHQLDQYAELSVRVGANLQPGQELIIAADTASIQFVRKLVKHAYAAGAFYVHVLFNDEEITRTRFLDAPEESFKHYPEWLVKIRDEVAEKGGAYIYVDSQNPDLLQGVKPERIAAATKASGTALKKFREYVSSDKISWNIVAVPSPEWAAKVFPNLSAEEQMKKLWEAIFKATRIDQEDPVAAWHQHDDILQERVEFLNQKRYRKLHYRAPGTDLTIELPEKHLWLGGSSPDVKGVRFFANMPTEEVFTMPKKDGVNGKVSSTKPLNYGGNLIDNFSLTFEDGRIVDFQAEMGYEVLKHLIETDEGSHFLGEIALVPHDSPISNQNIIFFNTLFDENASCHLAIGNAYSTNLEGGVDMSEEELAQHGANISITHVDFMIGSAALDIDGITADGKEEPIFRKGNWALG